MDCTDGVDGVLMGRAVGCCLVGCREGKRDSNWTWLLAVIRPGSWGNGREMDRLTTMTTTKKQHNDARETDVALPPKR